MHITEQSNVNMTVVQGERENGNRIIGGNSGQTFTNFMKCLNSQIQEFQ